MSATIKLVQLNIEHSKHLALVLPFLVAQKPDVICLQELCEPDIAQFEEALGMQCFYTPMTVENGVVGGVGIFSQLPKLSLHAEQYGGLISGEVPVYINTDKQTAHDTSRFVLAMCDIEKEGEVFRIGTTHFPVTKHAEVTEFQREDMKSMLANLEKEGEFVFTGDFNAPRGGEIFAQLAEKYTDNVPARYTSSIDGTIHRAGHLPHMVDGIFSTPGYSVSNVVMLSGVSDHCALVAIISRN